MMISSGVCPWALRFDAAYERKIHRVETNHTLTHNRKTIDAAITSWLDLFLSARPAKYSREKSAEEDNDEKKKRMRPSDTSALFAVVVCDIEDVTSWRLQAFRRSRSLQIALVSFRKIHMNTTTRHGHHTNR